jgi:hypothetical protein
MGSARCRELPRGGRTGWVKTGIASGRRIADLVVGSDPLEPHLERSMCPTRPDERCDHRAVDNRCYSTNVAPKGR